MSSHKPPRDTRARNRIFFLTVIAAVAVGLWVAR
ncbi:CRISPR/Cas system CMR subunit Cmr6 (Cas7 group RAMP superfamily) [Halomonas stenophila]|uniref:CRISPR/Cas system CMR subunit Cmr6 (Cas7 group RAMP superfamily) n=1 Tax=Halomonas stenophila TaxID=795312 RepID=A0A7W5ESC5_9GAMM|nr:CRISPR/Cas system CMR subunit Cmr6 (Cas7 group RAMP superfamily) [Halomonas stenophila]